MLSLSVTLVLALGVSSIFAGPPPACRQDSQYEADFSGCISYHSEATSMIKAEAACQGRDGHLISIHNAFENSIISSIIFSNQKQKEPVWIGLFRDNTGLCVWSDGTSTDYQRWALGEPASEGAMIDPTAAGFWKTANKTTEHPYICIEPSMEPTKPPLPAWTSCPPGWSYFAETNACYITGANATYDTAHRTCVVLGGLLASIHSEHENFFVASLEVTDLYSSYMWIGAVYDEGWGWEDGTPMDYKNYQYGSADESQSLAVSTSSRSSFTEWDVKSKKTVASYFVCKHPLYL